jgi:hypothetical protein
MDEVSFTQNVAEVDVVEQAPYGALLPHPSSQEYSGVLHAASEQNLMLPRSLLTKGA